MNVVVAKQVEIGQSGDLWFIGTDDEPYVYSPADIGGAITIECNGKLLDGVWHSNPESYEHDRVK
jgi:hypothetical protein